MRSDTERDYQAGAGICGGFLMLCNVRMAPMRWSRLQTFKPDVWCGYDDAGHDRRRTSGPHPQCSRSLAPVFLPYCMTAPSLFWQIPKEFRAAGRPDMIGKTL